MEIVDYYKILEINYDATQETIRKSYLLLAKKYHPDISSLSSENANKKMQLLNEAYCVLSNPQSKANYDVTVKTSAKKTSINKSTQETFTGNTSEILGGTFKMAGFLFALFMATVFLYILSMFGTHSG